NKIMLENPHAYPMWTGSKEKFRKCQGIMTALGDETRQYLLFAMLGGECGGSRVVDIAKRTNLFRPAVSHHMQILKNAGIVRARREGTYIYYYLDPDMRDIDNMSELFADIKRIAENLPDRSGEE
ncbi:MAG: ArsR/SmtB family transcription factor, partial [Oscillospiraceae bacterium]